MAIQIGTLKAASALLGSDHGPLMAYLVADTEAELLAALAAVLEEGNLGYAKDTDTLWTFDGAAWQPTGGGVTDHGDLDGLADDDHPQYETATEVNTKISTHEAAGDPHTGYQKESEKGSAGGYASLDGGGTVPDAQIPAAIARDTEVTAAVSAHAAAGDPHPTYLTSAEGDAAYDALGVAAAGDAAHAAAGDPHPVYETSAEAAAKVTAHENDTTAIHGIANTAGLVVKPATPTTYTQTYSTATQTHAARTAAALTDSSGGTADTTVQALPNPADSPLTADALRDDLVANLIPALRNNLADLVAQVNALRADQQNTAQVLNSVIDDGQAVGLAQ